VAQYTEYNNLVHCVESNWFDATIKMIIIIRSGHLLRINSVKSSTKAHTEKKRLGNFKIDQQ